MYTLLISFLLSIIICIWLWATEKINEGKMALIFFISAVCFLLSPAIIEKQTLIGDMQMHSQFIDAEVYYEKETEKYYALYDSKNSFEFWHLYELKEIDKSLLKEKMTNQTVTTRLLS